MVVCPPAVLTLQLKRFHNVGGRMAKANKHVQFPLVLDLAPFTSTIAVVSIACLLFNEKALSLILVGNNRCIYCWSEWIYAPFILNRIEYIIIIVSCFIIF